MLPIGSTIKGTENGLCEYSFEVPTDEGTEIYLCEYSFEELFRDLQLTDRNHVQILCKPYAPSQRLAPIVKKIGVHVECNCLSLQSGLGLPMDTENGSDLGLAFDSSNVDGFDLGSSSMAQLVPAQIRSNPNPMAITFSNLHTESYVSRDNLTKDDIKISLVKMDFSLYLHYDILRSDAEKDDCKSSKRRSYCVSVFCFFALRHFCIKKEYGFK
ncbi:hypothetical protein CMV_019951 [Castanea mollissima]|uniref:Uncharacterized protein n=1 Tax=Castanea mollissima TaxID=60419 RepID=A0A8J4VMA1_9ROSI|nr:hypothetical protein CMV_019951 [Castanea mollissima]